MHWLPFLVLLAFQTPLVSAGKSAVETLQQAHQLFEAKDFAGARRGLEQAIDLAVQEKNIEVEAQARYELGHTLGLQHCENYQCVMSSSHGVEWIDLKGSHFCGTCRSAIPTREQLNFQNRVPLNSSEKIH